MSENEFVRECLTKFFSYLDSGGYDIDMEGCGRSSLVKKHAVFGSIMSIGTCVLLNTSGVDEIVDVLVIVR